MAESLKNHKGGVAVADSENPVSLESDTISKSASLPQQHEQLETDTAAQSQQTDILQSLRNFRVEFDPGTREILSFTNQLAVMIRAGISLPDALGSIADQQTNLKFERIIRGLKEKIESGNSFSEALLQARCGSRPVFSNIYINMVAAAEISGSMSEMLQKLSEYLSRDAETRSQIKGAMVYPLIIAVMAVSVTIFLLCFVLPKFGGIFAGKEHLLPAPTKILMGSSAFIRGYWYFILPAVALIIGGFMFFINTKPGRFWWDKTKLVLPIIKKLCRSLYITRGLHTMGVLTHAGVPILDTIAITAQVSGNIFYENMWKGVEKEVRQGKKIAASLKHYGQSSGMIPSDVVQMISSGEDSGTMCEVLGHVSDYYARELKTVIKTVTSMIEPIMIVLMGVLVGFIAMSIMLPIFKMSSLVAGK
jgi:type IV pilus assembly protein PilC